jgi:hypothetical protein
LYDGEIDLATELPCLQYCGHLLFIGLVRLQEIDGSNSWNVLIQPTLTMAGLWYRRYVRDNTHPYRVSGMMPSRALLQPREAKHPAFAAAKGEKFKIFMMLVCLYSH